jgi:aldehyde dehydrogenase (NAD+)
MRMQHYIANSWVAPSKGESIPVVDPSDGASFGEIARGNERDVGAAVAAARVAIGETFDGPWGVLTAAQRGRLLYRFATAVADRSEELAALEARDTGKSMKTARTDAVELARYLEYYAGACDKLHGEILPYQPVYMVMTVREPHGVTAHIIPWNYRSRSSGARSVPH